jgi:hypothetical protein
LADLFSRYFSRFLIISPDDGDYRVVEVTPDVAGVVAIPPKSDVRVKANGVLCQSTRRHFSTGLSGCGRRLLRQGSTAYL